MAIRRIKIEFECSMCKKKEVGTTEHILTNTSEGLETTVNKANLLPVGWISLDWLIRKAAGSGGERDSGDFCSTNCATEYIGMVRD